MIRLWLNGRERKRYWTSRSLDSDFSSLFPVVIWAQLSCEFRFRLTFAFGFYCERLTFTSFLFMFPNVKGKRGNWEIGTVHSPSWERVQRRRVVWITVGETNKKVIIFECLLWLSISVVVVRLFVIAKYSCEWPSLFCECKQHWEIYSENRPSLSPFIAETIGCPWTPFWFVSLFPAN